MKWNNWKVAVIFTIVTPWLDILFLGRYEQDMCITICTVKARVVLTFFKKYGSIQFLTTNVYLLMEIVIL